MNEPGTDLRGSVGDNGVLQLYGLAERSPTAWLHLAIKPMLDSIINRFYEHLANADGISHLINCLSADELRHLKTQQAENLSFLCAPDLDAATHEQRALRIGAIHAQTGLNRDALATSQSILLNVLHRYVDKEVHAQALLILGQRLLRDLSWQLQAAQEIQLQRSAVLMKLSHLAWHTRTYAELIAEATEALAEHTEVAGCVVLRPDHQGVFQIDAAAGPGAAEYFDEVIKQQSVWSEDEGDTSKCCISALAWRSSIMQHCLNIMTDARTVPWRAMAKQWGFRSGASVPLIMPGDKTATAVLTLFNTMPGGFSSQEQASFCAQLQSLLAFGISRVQSSQKSTSLISSATRRRWMNLLRSDGLAMYYQPVLDLKTGKVSKVEALARLQDGAQVLEPTTFFPAMSGEDFFALYARGLEQILAQRQQWLSTGLDIQVSINLPPQAFSDIRYYEITQQTLQRFERDPTQLVLELLETDEIPKGVAAEFILERFKSLSVKLAEDDLGAGHSSLTRLRELPFDIIKIDRSIVMHVDKDTTTALQLVRQLTRLGHALGKQVVVEGIESEDMLRASIILGVDSLQGYLISPPMPPAAATAWLQHYYQTPFFKNASSKKTAISCLAQLLIWEEELAAILLMIERADNIEQPMQPEAPHADCLLPAMVIDNLRSNLTTILPATLAPLARALIEAAVNQGLNSDEYRAIRNAIMTALQSGNALD